jgi:hypothetical protein
MSGPDSSVGMATGYRLDGLGIESRCGRDFPHLSRPALGPTQSCTMGTGSFLGVNSGWGVTVTSHPLLVPLVMKEQSYTSTPPMGRTACTEPQCLYSRAIPLLPLWAVRPVQTLSACTRVHSTLF